MVHTLVTTKASPLIPYGIMGDPYAYPAFDVCVKSRVSNWGLLLLFTLLYDTIGNPATKGSLSYTIPMSLVLCQLGWDLMCGKERFVVESASRARCACTVGAWLQPEHLVEGSAKVAFVTDFMCTVIGPENHWC